MLPKAHELRVSVLCLAVLRGRLWESPACRSGWLGSACWLCEQRWQQQATVLAGILAGDSGDGAVAVKQRAPNS